MRGSSPISEIDIRAAYGLYFDVTDGFGEFVLGPSPLEKDNRPIVTGGIVHGITEPVSSVNLDATLVETGRNGPPSTGR